MPGYQDPTHRDHWKRCAQVVIDPFKNAWIATRGGIIIEPDILPYGLEMNYLRTGDPAALQAINYMSGQSPWGTMYAVIQLAVFGPGDGHTFWTQPWPRRWPDSHE